ncbi:rhomboid family intramembrane serine protease [Ascidiimonas aurantiaca]|uniref:rhomboid family intramembrane serine protease n=1 Tax=Ascidiimonas aurantiaca TaxID=1685432 RepID=UPI0030EE647C
MSVRNDLRYRFAMLSVAEKLIFINALVYILSGLIVFLFKLSNYTVSQWFHLPTNFMEFLVKPWTLITYSFFHGGFFHVLFNMILLYFSGRIFLNLYGNRRFLNVYFLGAMAGGLVFLISYNLFPVFLETNTYLIGASAAVMAVLIFVCTYIPNQEVRIIFFNVKLWYIGVFFVLLDLIQIPISNPGGHLAHLGGAFLGYIYARKLGEGKDIGAWFGNAVASFGRWFKPSKKKPLRTVHRKKVKTEARPYANSQQRRSEDIHQQKIDAILDKISKSGYESLSKEEKDYLFQAGKD